MATDRGRSDARLRPCVRPRGIGAASVTPLTAGFRVDGARLAAHGRRLFTEGCDFVSVFGSTGEGASLTVEERVRATSALIADGIPGERLVPAVIASSLEDARSLYRGYAAAGCAAALIMPPFFFRPTARGVAAFFDNVVGRDARLPFFLYHYPQMSGFGFDGELIERLCDTFGPLVAGIKDSAGERGHTLGLINRFPDLAVFTGSDTDFAATCDAGGAGIIGGVPNLTAALLKHRQETGETPDLDRTIATLFGLIAEIGGPEPVKTLLAHRDNDPAWLRTVPPLKVLALKFMTGFWGRRPTLGKG
ncbi:MAG: dihydrodipicolinate synthase family protein [Pseudomonadota bacterium]